LTGPAPAPRDIAKAIGWSIAFMLIGLGFTTLLFSLAALAYGGGDLRAGTRVLEQPGGAQTLAAGVSQLLGFGIATWIVGFKFLRLDRGILRWEAAARGVPGMLGGLALGAVAAGGALLAAVLAGSAYWSRDDGGAEEYAVQVAKTLFALVPAALSEELMFRGVPLVLLAAVTSRGTALLVVSALTFSAFHWFNPAVTPLAIGNIALAGLFLGVAFYAPGGLWTAFGAHLGWNATLAALDAPVSGLPYRIPLLDYHAGEPAWLSGGQFGPEGGLVSTVALAIAIGVAVRWARTESA
jgi:membrane protease YdiL (CAAX protease family)